MFRRIKSSFQTTSVEEWREKLGFSTTEATKRTLQGTTQLAKVVECETQEYMRDHFHARLHQLRPKRLNDTLFVDTHFSSITSVRSYKMWNTFSLKDAKIDKIFLMHRKSQSANTY